MDRAHAFARSGTLKLWLDATMVQGFFDEHVPAHAMKEHFLHKPIEAMRLKDRRANSGSKPRSAGSRTIFSRPSAIQEVSQWTFTRGQRPSRQLSPRWSTAYSRPPSASVRP